jgi:hypothetical protein
MRDTEGGRALRTNGLAIADVLDAVQDHRPNAVEQYLVLVYWRTANPPVASRQSVSEIQFCRPETLSNEQRLQDRRERWTSPILARSIAGGPDRIAIPQASAHATKGRSQYRTAR